MKQSFFAVILVIISLIGLTDAGYITYEKAMGLTPACRPGFDCGGVLESPYASIGPIPLSAIGVFYYLSVFILASSWLLEIDLLKKIGSHFKKLTTAEILTAMTGVGFLFSMYLIFVMGVLLKAWCLYCLISATTSTLLFLVMSYYNLTLHQQSYDWLKGAWLNLIGFIYRHLVKPIFFLIDAEAVHNAHLGLGELLGKFQITRKMMAVLFHYAHPQNQVKLMGINFPGKMGLAAGFDYNGQLTQILPDLGFGWQTVGTVTYHPYQGNPKPRLGRFPNSKALLVNKGLKSWGAKQVIKHLAGKQFRIPVAISIASTNQSFENDQEQMLDMLKSFQLFENSQVSHSLYELNISCPNTFGGEPFTTPKRLDKLLKATDKLKLSKPMLLKMPIDQSEKDTLSLLKVASKHKVDGVIFGNLTKDHQNPAVTAEDRAGWGKRKGNLSGKPTFVRSNNLIKLTKQHFGNRFVIVGTGGIFSPEDAEKKIKLGADLLQLITGMIFEGPQLISQINRQLATKQV